MCITWLTAITCSGITIIQPQLNHQPDHNSTLIQPPIITKNVMLTAYCVYRQIGILAVSAGHELVLLSINGFPVITTTDQMKFKELIRGQILWILKLLHNQRNLMQILPDQLLQPLILPGCLSHQFMPCRHC